VVESCVRDPKVVRTPAVRIEVLDEDRHAVEWPERPARPRARPARARPRLAGGGERLVGADGHEGCEERLGLLDGPQHRRDELDR
jgi:hypothetical protein